MKLTWLQTSTAGPSSGIVSRARVSRGGTSSAPASRRGSASGTRAPACRCRSRPRALSERDHEEELRDREPPRCSSAAARTAATTMNSAFRMLFAAITRARCDGSRAALDQREQRHDVEAGEQRQQEEIDQHAPVRLIGRRTAPTGRPVAASASGYAKYRSSANSVMPIEPNGTRPISTLWPDSRSHSSDPTPMPIENTASSSVTTVLVAAQRFLGVGRELREEHRAEEPEPRDAQHDRNTVRLLARVAEVAPGLA